MLSFLLSPNQGWMIDGRYLYDQEFMRFGENPLSFWMIGLTSANDFVI